MSNKELLNQIETLFKEAHSKYLAVFDLSNQQLKELEKTKPDTNRFARLMEEKMTLFHEIRRNGEQNEAIKNQWENDYRSYSDEDRRPIAELRETLMNTIEQLASMEEEIAAGIKKCEAGINRQLAAIQKGRQATNAYFNIDWGPPRFIDRKR